MLLINYSCTAQYHHVLFFKQQYTHYVPINFTIFWKVKRSSLKGKME